jgi:hypothetical protein
MPSSGERGKKCKLGPRADSESEPKGKRKGDCDLETFGRKEESPEEVQSAQEVWGTGRPEERQSAQEQKGQDGGKRDRVHIDVKKPRGMIGVDQYLQNLRGISLGKLWN